MEKSYGQLSFDDENGQIFHDLLYVNDAIIDFDRKIQETNYRVYGYTGGWGVGKTTFIRIWEDQLEKSKYIHIDAFKHDHYADPFLVISSAISKYAKEYSKTNIRNQFRKEVRKHARNILNVSGKLVMNIIIEKTIGAGKVKDSLNALYDKTVNAIVESSEKSDETLNSIREAIENITANLDTPLYIIIDELDRCRPTFAINLLERVKHIFTVNGTKFILVYNSDILKSIIEKEYGIKNDGNRYLAKFIEKEIRYTPSEKFSQWYFKLVEEKKGQFKSPKLARTLQFTEISKYITKLYRISQLTLRDTINIIASLESYSGVHDRHLYLVISLELLKYIDYGEYIEIVRYVNDNDRFASDLPLRQSFNKILQEFNKEMDLEKINNSIGQIINAYFA